MPRAVRWLRERWNLQQAVRAAPALRRPRRQKLPPVRRNAIAAWWAARTAAAAGIPLHEFLRHRLARYLGALPIPESRLPYAVEVEDSGVVVSTQRAGGAASAHSPWLDRYLRSNGSAALREDLQLAHAEVARLAAVRDEQAARVAAAAEEARRASADTAVIVGDGGAETLGRPPVPPPWPLLFQLLALALLLAEAWHLAIPVLAGAGVRADDLAGELQRNPAGVVLGLVFGLGAAVSLFLFVGLAIRRLAELLEGLSPRARRGWAAGAAVASATFAVAVSWSVAGLRLEAGRLDSEYGRVTLFLLALALPVTASILLRAARRLAKARDEALRRAAEWDLARHRIVSTWSRADAALAAAERDLAKVEAARVEAIRRLRSLQDRAVLAEQFAADAAADEALELERLCRTLVTSLELDRYEYLKAAGPTGVGMHSRVSPTQRDSSRSLGLAG